MTLKEKYLYHQIHPVKLGVDILSTLVGVYPLWHHELLPALLIMIPPGFITSLLLVSFANLEPLKESRFGNYVAHHMTRAAEAQRALAMCVVAAGIWNHSWMELCWGIGVLLVAWLQGVWPLSDTV